MRKKKTSRKEKKESQLLKYWDKTRKTLTPKQLISLVKEIEYLPIKRGAVETFLEIEGLVFDTYYKMLNAAQDLFEQDRALSEKFYKKFFDISTADHLMELILEGNTKAAEELICRIDARKISGNKSKQILMTLFEKITDAASRKNIYKKVEKFDLEEKELSQIAEIANRAFLYDIVDKIRKKIAWLKKRRNKKEKVLQKIRRLLQDINEAQKKEEGE